MKVYRKALTLFFLLSLVLSLMARTTAFAEVHKSAPDEEEPKNGFQKTIIENHRSLSILFDDIAEQLDSFLVSSQLIKTQNETQVIITNSNILTDGEGYNNTTNFSARLHLPNFEKYWQLKFTNYDDQTTDRGVRGSYLKQSAGSRNYGATVGFLRRFKSIEFKFQPRILLQNPLNISHSMSFESALETKTLRFSPKLEFFAAPEKSTGVFVSLNTGLNLTDVYSLIFVNEAEYQEYFHLFTATQGVSLGQLLDDISSMSYNLFFVSNNRPNYHLNNYSISVAYNLILYKEIIDTQLIPGLMFSDERGFRGVSSLTINFNIYF